MTETFTWCVRDNPTGTIQHRTRVAQFGDGYQQAAGDGINGKVQSWPVSFVGSGAYIGEIKDFLDARAGYESFFWTPPLEDQGYYRCASYDVIAHGADNYTLNATFQQVFQP